MENKTNAAMLGMLTAAVASWDSYDKDTQRRLAISAMTPMMRCLLSRRTSRAEADSGPSAAADGCAARTRAGESQHRDAEIIPTTTKLTRPAFDEESVQDLSFPPRTGTYDGSGR